MIRRPPRSTQSRSSAASDVYKRQDRELAVLAEVASGLSSKQIAASLFLSEGTVRNYLSAIFSKLGVHNRIEAVQMAKKNKWLE